MLCLATKHLVFTFVDNSRLRFCIYALLIACGNWGQVAKWPIRPELIPVSVAWSDWEYFYSLLDGMLVHRRVTPSIKFAGTHLYTWVERGTVRIKCLAQEHNTMSRPGLEPGAIAPESSVLTMRPLHLPLPAQPLLLAEVWLCDHDSTWPSVSSVWFGLQLLLQL